MASSPAATSPPNPSPLALPRQRPTLALPGGQNIKQRKPSIASNTSSAHPLRQTSFPPEASLLDRQHQEALAGFSPTAASPDDIDDFSDSEIVSAIDGPTGAGDGSARKRKRGEKRGRGRGGARGGMRAGTASSVGGEEGTPAKRGASAAVENPEDDDDDDDEERAAGGGRVPLHEGGQMSTAEYETDNKQKAMFRQYLEIVDGQPISAPGREGLTTRNMRERYDTYSRAKLKTGDVRKLVNQTVSQSVPANVVTVVSAYTKTFAGLLIEEARKVQAEWQAVAEKRPDGQDNAAYKRLKMMHVDDEDADGEHTGGPATNGERETEGNVKNEPGSSPAQQDAKPDGKENGGVDGLYLGGAAGLSGSIEECDRGPLLPDHLREALRRYKKSRKGGSVGFTGLSLEGRESAASRLGGKKLFR